jgi:hypothetical protein
MTESWYNWSRSVHCAPQRIERPESEAQLAALLRGAAETGLSVRVAGRGHSHTPLVATDGLLLELDALRARGFRSDAREATLRAGTRLRRSGPLLSWASRWRTSASTQTSREPSRPDARAEAGCAASPRSRDAPAPPALPNVRDERLASQAARVARCAQRGDRCALRLLPAYQLHERIWHEDVAPGWRRSPADRVQPPLRVLAAQKDRLELGAELRSAGPRPTAP